MTDRPLWAVEAMVAAMRAARNGRLPPSVPGISIDTRTIAPGEAFFAIKGDNRDGHDFVEAALAAGAGLAVVAADRRESFPKDAPLLIVADVLEGLRDLARASRARARAKIVAVTGSVGKTGTKEALRLTLARNGETHASVASYNNHWGVPLSLARCSESARYAVFELGMNHAGEIEPLARLVKCSLQSDTSTVQARIFGTDVTYKLGAPGRHLVLNSLAVLAAAALVGADLALAALALVDLQPASGRGARLSLDMPGGKALLI